MSRTERLQTGTRTMISGMVAKGFEHVRVEFERNFTDRAEVGAAVAAYWRGEKVVDLWAPLIVPRLEPIAAAPPALELEAERLVPRGSHVHRRSRPSAYTEKPPRRRASRGLSKLAPRVGFEPTTLRLTAECSTIELPRNEGDARGQAGPGKQRAGRLAALLHVGQASAGHGLAGRIPRAIGTPEQPLELEFIPSLA